MPPRVGPSVLREGLTRSRVGPTVPAEGPSIPREGPSAPRVGLTRSREGPSVPREGASAPREGATGPREGPSRLPGVNPAGAPRKSSQTMAWEGGSRPL
jgi:hypothetical protein